MDIFLDELVYKVIKESKLLNIATISGILQEQDTPYEIKKDIMWSESVYRLRDVSRNTGKSKMIDHVRMQMEEMVATQLSMTQYYGNHMVSFDDNLISTYIKEPVKKNDTFYRKLERKGGRKKW